MSSQAGHFGPRLPAVGGAEQGGVFDSRIHGIWLCERGLKVPHTLKFPWMRRAVVPLVSTGNAVVGEVITDRFPRLTAIIGTLYNLSGPAAGLRRIDAVRIGGRTLHVIDFPAREVGTAYVPVSACAVGFKYEGTLSCADENSYVTHVASVSPL